LARDFVNVEMIGLSRLYAFVVIEPQHRVHPGGVIAGATGAWVSDPPGIC
jgi:hypothetical protein